MFNKTHDDRGHAGGAGQVSVLASDLVITGSVSSEGTIEVHGNVDGELSAALVALGTNGQVKGKIQAGQVDVRGQLDGAINCGALTLRSEARVHADVQSTRLIIESGAEVEGRFSRPAPVVQVQAPVIETSVVPEVTVALTESDL